MLSNLIGVVMIGSSIGVGAYLFVKAAALEKEISLEPSAEENEGSETIAATADNEEELD